MSREFEKSSTLVYDLDMCRRWLPEPMRGLTIEPVRGFRAGFVLRNSPNCMESAVMFTYSDIRELKYVENNAI